jgi:hypothetical protein
VIGISFDPELLVAGQRAWWEAWSVRARKATDKLIDQFENWVEDQSAQKLEMGFNSAIWTELRTWYLEHLTNNKCAYCECDISGFPGDAEHYRPKGAVKFKEATGGFEIARWDLPNQAAAQSRVHPGYFWLAYDWRNLIPACSFCNSGLGKNERFDVGNRHLVLVQLSEREFESFGAKSKPLPSRKFRGSYYLSPESLDEREDPHVLNPLNPRPDRDPRKHIFFGVKGIVAPRKDSVYGKKTIEVLRLDREDLMRRRQKAQTQFQEAYFDALRKADLVADNPTAVTTLLAQYEKGEYFFSAAALDFHRIIKTRIP